jgi:hypothetical protein
MIPQIAPEVIRSFFSDKKRPVIAGQAVTVHTRYHSASHSPVYPANPSCSKMDSPTKSANDSGVRTVLIYLLYF